MTPTPLEVGLKGVCPRCGARGLFAGIVKFAPVCRACGLDYSSFDVGDGPAPFLIFVIGALTVGLALWLQLSQQPPFWVHLLIWPPLVIALTLGALRIVKGVLAALEWRNRAGEAGR